ncbi:TPA: hypothetical protein ACHG3F_003108 [Escherichia coli]
MSAKAMKIKLLKVMQAAVECGAIQEFKETQEGGEPVFFFKNKKGAAVALMLLKNSDTTFILCAGGYDLVADDAYITCATGLNPMLTFERRGIRVATFGGCL